METFTKFFVGWFLIEFVLGILCLASGRIPEKTKGTTAIDTVMAAVFAVWALFLVWGK